MDPLAKIAYNYSPSNYCGLNPLRFIDLYGLWKVTKDGYYIEEQNDSVMTFALTFNMSPENAQQFLYANGYIKIDGSFCLPVATVYAEHNSNDGLSPLYSSALTFGDWALPGNPNLSFRLRTNNKPFEIKIYKSGWMKGNQYLDKKYLHSTKRLAAVKRNIVRPIGNVFLAYSTTVSVTNFLKSSDSNDRCEYILDAVFNGIGMIPAGPAQAVSVYYSLGGKEATEYFLDYTSEMIQKNPYYRPMGLY